MGGHGEKRARKQEAAIIALLQAPTIEEAAKVCGIGESTLWRWMQQPDFQAAYRDARRRVVEAALAGLQQAAGEAVGALRKNLTCGQAGTEVRAAVAILEQAVKATELLELEERIARLEEALAGRAKEAAR